MKIISKPFELKQYSHIEQRNWINKDSNIILSFWDIEDIQKVLDLSGLSNASKMNLELSDESTSNSIRIRIANAINDDRIANIKKINEKEIKFYRICTYKDVEGNKDIVEYFRIFHYYKRSDWNILFDTNIQNGIYYLRLLFR